MIYCVHHPPLSAGEGGGGGGVDTPSKFSKSGDLTGSQFLEVVAGKEGGGLFQAEAQLLHKK